MTTENLRVELAQLMAAKDTYSLKNLAEKTIEQYRLLADEKNIAIQYECKEDVVIKANNALIEILLGNFVSNAIRHNELNGTVNIQSNSTYIIFKNSGGNLALDSEKIFQRFYKQTTDNNSIGLGLQIAQKIAEHYHFSILYSFEKNKHCFLLKLNQSSII